MQKQKEVTEQWNTTTLEYVLDHDVALQQLFKMEGQKKLKYFFSYFNFQAFSFVLLKSLLYLLILFVLYVRSPCQLLYIVHRKTQGKKQLWAWGPLSSALGLSPSLAKILTIFFN